MFLPHFDIICDLSDAWIFYLKIFHHYSKAGLCPLWQNEAVSLVVMRSKELWLVQENCAIVKLDLNGFSWNENLQQKQNWTAKSTVSVTNAALWAEKLGCHLQYCGGWKNSLGNLRLWSTLKAIQLEFWMKGALEMAEICVLCGWWFSNQFNIVSETCYSYNTVGRELYWTILCSL